MLMFSTAPMLIQCRIRPYYFNFPFPTQKLIRYYYRCTFTPSFRAMFSCGPAGFFG